VTESPGRRKPLYRTHSTELFKHRLLHVSIAAYFMSGNTTFTRHGSGGDRCASARNFTINDVDQAPDERHP
jgi:hypothetical protein